MNAPLNSPTPGQDAKRADSCRQPIAATGFVAESLAILFVHNLLRRLFWQGATLPESYYFSSSILAEVVRNIGDHVPLFLFTGLLLYFGRNLRWADFDYGRTVRNAVMTVAAGLAIAYSTYDYNLYFDQSHAFERLLILASLPFMWRSPVFVPPFLLLVQCVAQQFDYPLTQTYEDKALAIEFIILFSACVTVGLRRRRVFVQFLFLSIALTASFYFAAGMGKFHRGPFLSWILENEICNISMSARIHGWCRFVPLEQWLSLASVMQRSQLMMAIPVFLAECGSVFCFLHRRLLVLLLTFFCLFHLGVWLTTGICFWKWVLVDLGLIYMVLRFRRDDVQHLFVSRTKLVCIPILGMASILFSHYLFHPSSGLGWYDTRLSEMFEVEVVGRSGKIYRCSNNGMAPYDLVFSQNRFWYASDDKRLTGSFGGLGKHNVFAELQGAETVAEVKSTIETHGSLRYDETRTRVLLDFLETYFRNWNRRGSKKTLFSYLHGPRHIWNSPYENEFVGQEPAASVQIRQRRAFYDGSQIREIDNRLLHVVELSDESEHTRP